MKKRETLGVKVIKHFYGISGPLDEYKRQEVNRIGNNAFVWLWWYLLISSFIAALFSQKNPHLTLLIYIGSNMLVSGFIVSGYILIASHGKHLTEHEVSTKQATVIKHKILRNALFLGIYFAIGIHLLNGLTDWLTEGVDFYTTITAWRNIRSSALAGIIFGIFMYVMNLLRIKRIDE